MHDILKNNTSEKRVLSYIVRKGASSRKEISDKIGVTTATLTRAVSCLMEHDILRELGTMEEGRVGRRQVLLDVRQDLAYVCGFDVNNRYIRITIMNLHAEILEQKRWNYHMLTQEMLSVALQECDKLIKQYKPEKFLGIGLLQQGYIEGDICFSMPIKNIKTQIENYFNMPVFMMNNTRGLAVAEAYFDEKPCKSYIVIKYGPGVGSVIVQNGEILEGSHNRAGELGHILWNPAYHNKCPICGKTGCLESIIGYPHLAKRIAPEIDIQCTELTDLLKITHQKGDDALKDALKQLALAVNMMVDIIDPEKILLAGEIFKNDTYFKLFVEYLSKNSSEFNHHKVSIISHYEKKRICAAGVMVLNHYFGGEI